LSTGTGLIADDGDYYSAEEFRVWRSFVCSIPILKTGSQFGCKSLTMCLLILEHIKRIWEVMQMIDQGL
jgi:hypothetical protein